MKGKTSTIKRILASLAIICLVAFQMITIFPVSAYAEGGVSGKYLEIRVQYNGEREDKIRTKCVFSASDLDSMKSADHYFYCNVTSIGDIMLSCASGPEVKTVIESAGIDWYSIDKIYFRTDDGRGTHKRFSGAWSTSSLERSSSRVYYPNLWNHFVEGVPQKGAVYTDGKNTGRLVPPIIAVKGISIKSPRKMVDPAKMSSDNMFRLYLGQTALAEGKEVTQADVSSSLSLYSIFGIDVVLKGYPPISGISLSADSGGLTVGSSTQIHATIEGGGDVSEKDLQWSSDNEAAVSVSSSGYITINGEGRAVISAKADSGVTATMTFNVTGKTVQKEIENPDFNPDLEEGEGNSRTIIVDETEYSVSIESQDAKVPEEEVATKPLKKVAIAKNTEVKDIKKIEKPKTISVKQVKLSAVPKDAEAMQQASTNSQALERAEEYGPRTKAIAGGIGAGLFAAGVAFRIRRYRLDR